MSALSLRCPHCSATRCIVFDHVAKKVTVVCPHCKSAESGLSSKKDQP